MIRKANGSGGVERGGGTALVFSGGGARGAYAAGVIRYLRGAFADQVGEQPRFDYLSGSSVGAFNASWLAASMQHGEDQGELLTRMWTTFPGETLWKARVVQLARLLVGGELGEEDSSLLDWRDVEETVRDTIPWERLHANIDAGRLRGLAVTATEASTGHAVNFLQMAPGAQVSTDRWDPFAHPEPTRLQAEHVLASSALPVLFPSVRVGERYYVDGSLCQNIPLGAALRMGADRVLIVSVGRAKPFEPSSERPRWRRPSFVSGRLLDALLRDSLAQTLRRIEHDNQMIDAGRRAFGPRFTAAMKPHLDRRWGWPLRRIELMTLEPSVDPSQIALEVLAAVDDDRGSLLRHVKRMMRKLGTAGLSVAAAASFLMFDRRYLSRLIELGERDAAARHDELATLFGPAARGVEKSRLRCAAG